MDGPYVSYLQLCDNTTTHSTTYSDMSLSLTVSVRKSWPWLGRVSKALMKVLVAGQCSHGKAQRGKAVSKATCLLEVSPP